MVEFDVKKIDWKIPGEMSEGWATIWKSGEMQSALKPIVDRVAAQAQDNYYAAYASIESEIVDGVSSKKQSDMARLAQWIDAHYDVPSYAPCEGKVKVLNYTAIGAVDSRGWGSVLDRRMHGNYITKAV